MNLTRLKAGAAGFFLTVNALAQGAPELNSQFDAIRQSIGQRDFMSALQQALAISKFAIARARELSPSSEVVEPLNFPAGTGDVSYLLAMVEQDRVAWQSNDFVRLRAYSISLAYALAKELPLNAPKPTDVLTKQEQMASGMSENQRFYALPKLAKAAFDAGDFSKAGSYANELLATAANHPTWMQGDAIHYGNIVLGRIALQLGDAASASTRLLEAGKTPGTPALDTFGPNMALANELLANGQRDVVLQYLSECAAFWKMERGALSTWTSAIQAGKTPDFGANLRF
jgi:hypothetical protein